MTQQELLVDNRYIIDFEFKVVGQLEVTASSSPHARERAHDRLWGHWNGDMRDDVRASLYRRGRQYNILEVQEARE